MTHYLVIHDNGSDGDFDYDVEHEPDCPREIFTVDPGGISFEDFTCVISGHFTDIGIDCVETDDGAAGRDIPPGRYELEAWSRRYDGWYGTEWDAGVTARLVEEAP